jgi:hypothetical protein
MGTLFWIITACVVVGVILVVGGAVLTQSLLKRQAANKLQQAQREFRQRREWLEARFFSMAAGSGKPRGLAWTNCDFGNDVSFARDPDTDQLGAFVSVTVSFEAIEGGGMEDVEAVGNLRAGTAVFEYTGREWVTRGRVIFNLEPQQAIEHYRHRPLMAD